jgi:hypothetical protein
MIGCDIKPESPRNRKGVENHTISRKKQRVLPTGHTFKTPPYFPENENGTFKTLFMNIINIMHVKVSNYIFTYFIEYKILQLCSKC